MSPFSPAGFIISWHVPTTVQLADLRRGVAAIGLDPLDVVPDLNSASLVARTAGLLARGMSGKTTKRLARKVEHSKRQITAEVAGIGFNAGELEYHRDFAVQFDDATKTVVTDTGHDLTATATTIAETRRATDVTRVVQRVIEAAGSDLMQIRDQGGAYFVPAGHAVIEQVRTVLDAVGGNLKQFACTLGHGADADRTGQSVAVVITDYLLAQIAELQEAVAELNEAKIRSDVRRARLSRVATLKDRIAAYASLVGTHKDALDAALTRAEATLMAKLGPQPDDEEPEVEAVVA